MNLKQLLEKRQTILNSIQAAKTGEELDGLEMDLRKVDIEIAECRKLDDKEGGNGEVIEERTAAVNENIPAIVIEGAQQRNKSVDFETRCKSVADELRSGKEVTLDSEMVDFLESRAISTSGLLIENKYKKTIAEGPNEISQTIDIVTPVPLLGGSSYSVAFAIDTGDADYTEEGSVYTNDEGTFGIEETSRAKITSSAIVNEEVVELPDADYLSAIYNNIKKSIRKKVSNQIIAGAGTTNTLRGIEKNTTAIPTGYKEEIAAIDSQTIRKIVMGYVGDEEVTSELTLFLSKKTLGLFAAVTKADGDPFYKISYSGPNGYIQAGSDGLRVKYTINSALKDFEIATAGETTMIYGDPSAYELAMFSAITVKRSDERYIDKGQIGFFGKIIAGGLVSRYKAFLPIKKA